MISNSFIQIQFQAWYYQSGLNVRDTEVVMASGTTISPMAIIRGDQGSSWKKLLLEIGKRTEGFVVGCLIVFLTSE